MNNNELMYNKIDTVTKTINKFGDINVKHRAAVRTVFQNSKESIFFYQNKTTPNKTSAAIKQTYDGIILESAIGSMVNGSNQAKKPGVLFKYDDVYSVCTAFDNVYKWFNDERFKDSLFVYSEVSKLPYKIAERFKDLNVVVNLSVSPNSFLSIHPGIISDAINNISYPGVYFRSDSGLIGGCTMTEFFNLRICVKNLLINLYSISMELLNQYLTLMNNKYGG